MVMNADLVDGSDVQDHDLDAAWWPRENKGFGGMLHVNLGRVRQLAIFRGKECIAQKRCTILLSSSFLSKLASNHAHLE